MYLIIWWSFDDILSILVFQDRWRRYLRFSAKCYSHLWYRRLLSPFGHMRSRRHWHTLQVFWFSNWPGDSLRISSFHPNFFCSSFGRPVGIGVYGHPSHEESEYVLDLRVKTGIDDEFESRFDNSKDPAEKGSYEVDDTVHYEEDVSVLRNYRVGLGEMSS